MINLELIKMSEIMKKLSYAGLLAGGVGLGYFLSGAWKKTKWISTTALGITLFVCVPKGFEYLEKNNELKYNYKNNVLEMSLKKDSIDNILNPYRAKDTLSLNIHNQLKALQEENTLLNKKYHSMIESKEEKYQQSLKDLDSKTSNELSLIKKDISDQSIFLNSQLEKVSSIVQSNINSSIPQYVVSKSENVAKFNGISKNIFDRSISKGTIEKYIIDVDKSKKTVGVYVLEDGITKFTGVESKASFPSNNWPDDGHYSLKDKGYRFGNLYPGFIAIADPIGITGAGENNEYLEDIAEGLSTNKTSIRVPNDIYLKLSNFVTKSNATMYVHE
jgi:hypothetical protein